jgi:hypothetical protein
LSLREEAELMALLKSPDVSLMRRWIAASLWGERKGERVNN